MKITSTRGSGPALLPQKLDRIGCTSCGRWFTTPDGPSMLAAIEGPCPDCGGRFALISAESSGPSPVRHDDRA